MKFDGKTWIIVALVLLFAGFILFRKSPPSPDNGKNDYKDHIEILNSKLAEKNAQVASLFQESQHKDSTTKAQLSVKDKEIHGLKVKLAKQRPPIVLMADSIPALKAFIQAQDSLIAATEAKADTLQKAYTSQIETTRDLKRLIVDKDKIQQEMFTTCSERVDKLHRDYEKEHKRKTGWKKVAGIAIIVSLVEGALIALQ